ncbi:TPA: hypothetical protein ACGEYH_002906 [Providencia rettgeri]
MGITLRKNDTNIASGDTLAMMIQKKENKNSISKDSKKLIANEVNRLIQANSEESLKLLNEGWLALARINSDNVKSKIRKCFPDDICKINNKPIAIESNSRDSIKTQLVGLKKRLTPKTTEKKPEKKVKNNIKVVNKQLNNQEIKEIAPINIDVEFQLKITLATTSSIDDVKQGVRSYLLEKGVEEHGIKDCLKYIDELNKIKKDQAIKSAIENAITNTSSNEKDPKSISHIFIEQLKCELNGTEHRTHNKATSTSDLDMTNIDNILDETCSNDDKKLTIPIELTKIINEAVEREYLSEINLVEVKSLLRKMKRDETSEVYSSAIGYLKYGINFPIGSNNEKKINKVIHEVENPSVKYRILNFFIDMKFKMLRIYNNLF